MIAKSERLPKQSIPKVGQKHFRIAEVDVPSTTFTGRLIQDEQELEQLVPQWNRLVDTSVRVNSFFHPSFLIPAVSHLGDDNISVVVIEAPRRVNPGGSPVICALFPVIKKRIYGLPFKCLEIWKHDQCFDCTPLIRHDCAAEVLEFALGFLADELKANLFSANTIIGEGPISNLFSDNFYQTERTVFHRDEFTRSCFRPMFDAETFINTKVAKNTRKGSQRLRRKLAQQGIVETNFLYQYDRSWVDEFLSLESAGWKGKTGTAISSTSSARDFFHDMTRRMFASNSMVISRTSLDNRPIAMTCDLQLASRGAHFKTAFDENLKDFSPGIFVELDNIHRFHQANLEFVDSCADPDHSMINRIWRDRVRFQSFVVALRGPISQVAVSAMPLIQQAKKFLTNRGKHRDSKLDTDS